LRGDVGAEAHVVFAAAAAAAEVHAATCNQREDREVKPHTRSFSKPCATATSRDRERKPQFFST
jgi:hypothetical protein